MASKGLCQDNEHRTYYETLTARIIPRSKRDAAICYVERCLFSTIATVFRELYFKSSWYRTDLVCSMQIILSVGIYCITVIIVVC